MKSIFQLGWRSGALLGALALTVACGPIEAAQPTPIAATTPLPTSTSAPAATAAPTTAPTTQPSAIPAATATSQPTLEPTVAVAPTATPAPTSVLPNDVPWVHSAGTVFADDETFDLVKHGLPAPAYHFQVARDGATVAYISQQGHLIIADLRTSQAIVGDQAGIMVAGYAFAPDSRGLLFTTPENQAELVDLPGGQRHTLKLGPQPDTPSGMDTGLIPIAWTEQGLFAQQVLWGTDAPPQGIVRLDPTTGALTLVSQLDHLNVAVSHDGKQLALVTGSAPISAPPSTGITVLDLASSQATPIVPEQPQLISALSWSGDGTQILYASIANYDTPETRLQLATIGSTAPAGTPNQAITIDTYRDIAWGSSGPPLLLTAEKDRTLQLYWVEFSDQGIISLAPSVAFAAPAAEQIDGQIVYTP